jgi:P-type E1-E2 ATPase
MIELDIPGRARLQLDHLVCDVNGTLALDGVLREGLESQILRLSKILSIHLITADTHGRQSAIDQQLGMQAVRLHPGSEAAQKADYVRRLGVERVAALGQGANDAAMLREAAIGICVLSPEGTSLQALTAADLLVPDIYTALDLFEHPLRLIASLRE